MPGSRLGDRGSRPRPGSVHLVIRSWGSEGLRLFSHRLSASPLGAEHRSTGPCGLSAAGWRRLRETSGSNFDSRSHTFTVSAIGDGSRGDRSESPRRHHPDEGNSHDHTYPRSKNAQDGFRVAVARRLREGAEHARRATRLLRATSGIGSVRDQRVAVCSGSIGHWV